MSYLFNTLLYQPLYNGFIFLVGAFPWIDAGIVVIIFTILIKIIIFPLSQKAIKSQMAIKEIQPEVDALKTKYKDNRQEQSLKILDLYRSKGVNPFAGVLLALVQLPILIALYMVFYKGGIGTIHMETLYTFVEAPTHIKTVFIGLLDIREKSILLALIVAIAQYAQISFTLPKTKPKVYQNGEKPSFGDDLAKSMTWQMKYVMPIVIFFVAQSFAAIVSLYLLTSSLFAIGQELYLRRKTVKTE